MFGHREDGAGAVVVVVVVVVVFYNSVQIYTKRLGFAVGSLA